MTDKQTSDKESETLVLSKRIQQFEDKHRQNNLASDRLSNKGAKTSTAALAMAGRLMTELVSGLIVGTAVGWGVDYWLGTTPLFMIIMFFLGAAAGIMNMWRTVKGYGMVPNFFDDNNKELDKQPVDEQYKVDKK